MKLINTNCWMFKGKKGMGRTLSYQGYTEPAPHWWHTESSRQWEAEEDQERQGRGSQRKTKRYDAAQLIICVQSIFDLPEKSWGLWPEVLMCVLRVEDLHWRSWCEFWELRTVTRGTDVWGPSLEVLMWVMRIEGCDQRPWCVFWGLRTVTRGPDVCSQDSCSLSWFTEGCGQTTVFVWVTRYTMTADVKTTTFVVPPSNIVYLHAMFW